MMIICDTCVGIHIRIYNKEVLVMSASKDTKRGTWKVYIRYKDWQGIGQVHTKRGFATKREALEYEREFLLKKSKDQPQQGQPFCSALLNGLQAFLQR